MGLAGVYLDLWRVAALLLSCYSKVVDGHQEAVPQTSVLNLPRFSVSASQHGIGLGIADHLLLVGVPMDFSACVQSDVSKVGRRRRTVALLYIGNRLFSAFDAIQEITNVGEVLL